MRKTKFSTRKETAAAEAAEAEAKVARQANHSARQAEIRLWLRDAMRQRRPLEKAKAEAAEARAKYAEREAI